MSKTFNPIRPVQTRGGRPARILCIDARGTQPIVAASLDDEGGQEIIQRNNRDGHYWESGMPDARDLINIPQPLHREFWGNIYQGSIVCVAHNSREQADRNADDGRVACVKVVIDCKEGDGLGNQDAPQSHAVSPDNGSAPAPQKAAPRYWYLGIDGRYYADSHNAGPGAIRVIENP